MAKPSASETIRSISQAIRDVAGNRPGPLPLHAPEFSGAEWLYVKECLDTGWVSSVGSFVDRFEGAVAEACRAPHAVAVANGTVALQVALTLAGVAPGTEVLVPALTFVATANAVMHAGAVPHFVDSDRLTLGIDPSALRKYLEATCRTANGRTLNKETGRYISAMVPVHVFGHPVAFDELKQVAEEWNLPIVEDATEALGSQYRDRFCGGLDRIGVISFNGNKILTTGGGGAIVSTDEEVAIRAKHLTTTAKMKHRWAFVHDEVGYNYRLPNLNAALGVAQFEQLSTRLAEKRHLARKYTAAFADSAHATVIAEPNGTRSNYWLNAIRLHRDVATMRDQILDGLNDDGLMCRPVWVLLHRLRMFETCPRSPLPVAEELEQQIVCLPSSAELGRL